MNLILAAGSLTAWALMSRYLFRRWLRSGITKRSKECSHGYSEIHKHQACRPVIPVPHSEVAAMAIAAALFFPVTLFITFVIARPPLSPQELDEKIEALQAENDRMRREQEGLPVDDRRWRDGLPPGSHQWFRS